MMIIVMSLSDKVSPWLMTYVLQEGMMMMMRMRRRGDDDIFIY
jgi:hypothetical protein